MAYDVMTSNEPNKKKQNYKLTIFIRQIKHKINAFQLYVRIEYLQKVITFDKTKWNVTSKALQNASTQDYNILRDNLKGSGRITLMSCFTFKGSGRITIHWQECKTRH